MRLYDRAEHVSIDIYFVKVRMILQQIVPYVCLFLAWILWNSMEEYICIVNHNLRG